MRKAPQMQERNEKRRGFPLPFRVWGIRPAVSDLGRFPAAGYRSGIRNPAKNGKTDSGVPSPKIPNKKTRLVSRVL